MSKPISTTQINAIKKEYDFLKPHNTGLRKQNLKLQQERYRLLIALRLAITDKWVDDVGSEPTEKQLRAEVVDYLQQAEIELNASNQEEEK